MFNLIKISNLLKLLLSKQCVNIQLYAVCIYGI